MSIKDQWKLSQYYADLFWSRWLQEYLPTLHPRKKWHKRADPLKVNDIVLIMENGIARNEWLKGVVSEVCPGRDGEIRMVKEIAIMPNSEPPFSPPSLLSCPGQAYQQL